MSTIEPNYIIAIGASAGGVEELITFFDHTPLDNVSYIVVQHLSPDYRSRMDEILDKHSKLKLNLVQNGMRVECNQVYLIPSDKLMTIRDGRLFLSDKEQSKGPHLTVDIFFSSLATDIGKKAIGIIFSGLGSDGSEGIQAIKKAGGMVMVRNPATSDFSSMPSHAIATGMVDYILEPELMPDTIQDYVKLEGELLTDNKDDEKILVSIIELINENSPHDFSDYKQPTLLRRTIRRAIFHNFNKLENYLNFLKKSPEEVYALSQEFLISVTSFFRDKEAFDFLETDILPQILQKLQPKEELKMWVAGCATGEEAYSLAIFLNEQLVGKYKDTVVKIFATDIDATALMQAGKGSYGSNITKNVSPERLEKYFFREGENYWVNPEIRKMVIFAQHDLVKNPPYCNMQLISCRNLLIYMTPTLQKKIFNMLLFGLKVDGYLFLGSSENPIPIIQNLEVVNKKWKIYKNISTKRNVHLDAFSLPELTDIKRSSVLSNDNSYNSINNWGDIVSNTLVSEMNNLVICVDESNQVVKTFGDTSKFLIQKNFTSDLVELLPRTLAVAFNTLRIKALKINEKCTLNGININHGESLIKVNISVSPLLIKKREQKWLIVSFSENTSNVPAQMEDVILDQNLYFNQYTRNLEDELKELREKLYFAYEKLDASNENLQSFNEELLSANEEMQSTNEEMQSINEELHTINADFQLKNKELIEINDDLNNYFRSNINGQLFVNNDMILMRFSPGTVNQINLLPTDIGRPLSHISTNIKFETIAEDIKKVISEGSIISKEVQTDNGKWYQIMTMPYLLSDNKQNGAILTFNDISELKKNQFELDKNNKILLRINDDHDSFIYTVSHDLLEPLANIQSLIGLINETENEDPVINNYYSLINTSLIKFRSLIKEISVISRLESDIVTEMVDIDELINDIEWSLSNKITSSQAVINRKFEIKHIQFSKKNLRSILFNLIANSIKFKGDKNPKIYIHTIKTDEHVILSVQDNGIGIDKNGLDKIFGKYVRIQQDIEGQGIGLYLAKKIIDASGGNIIVESEVGKGSKFSLYFKINSQTL